MRVYRTYIALAILCLCSLTTRAGVSPVLSFAQSVSLAPSLHVRVYRPCTKATRRETGSLTTREGVSPFCPNLSCRPRFPHYTWGCIGCKDYKKAAQISSLTTREGVSNRLKQSYINWAFPHYTWGCIGQSNHSRTGIQVPSLYVRVYHSMWTQLPPEMRSLTTREGVSRPRCHQY